MTNDSRLFNEQGFAHLKSFFDVDEIIRVREDAKFVFIKQMSHLGIIGSGPISEEQFERSLFEYFIEDRQGFINCGKTCQHLISLHRLSLSNRLIEKAKQFGLACPSICTRPVMYFNSRHLAIADVYYKSPPHQDWRSMQGSLNALVVWVPLVNINEKLGALQIIPGSHLMGLQDSIEDEWFRHIETTKNEHYVSVEVEAGDALFFFCILNSSVRR